MTTEQQVRQVWDPLVNLKLNLPSTQEELRVALAQIASTLPPGYSLSATIAVEEGVSGSVLGRIPFVGRLATVPGTALLSSSNDSTRFSVHHHHDRPLRDSALDGRPDLTATPGRRFLTETAAIWIGHMITPRTALRSCA